FSAPSGPFANPNDNEAEVETPCDPSRRGRDGTSTAFSSAGRINRRYWRYEDRADAVGRRMRPGPLTVIRRMVKIEMGARADHWPCETKPVTPYVAEQFPQEFREPDCAVKVLSAERTFWEKATIL